IEKEGTAVANDEIHLPEIKPEPLALGPYFIRNRRIFDGDDIRSLDDRIGAEAAFAPLAIAEEYPVPDGVILAFALGDEPLDDETGICPDILANRGQVPGDLWA